MRVPWVRRMLEEVLDETARAKRRKLHHSLTPVVRSQIPQAPVPHLPRHCSHINMFEHAPAEAQLYVQTDLDLDDEFEDEGFLWAC